MKAKYKDHTKSSLFFCIAKFTQEKTRNSWL